MTNIQLQAMHSIWCAENNIIIYAEGIKNSHMCRIIVNFKGKKIIGTKTYKQKNLTKGDEKWWEVIYKLREEYYNKFNKN